MDRKIDPMGITCDWDGSNINCDVLLHSVYWSSWLTTTTLADDDDNDDDEIDGG